MSKKNRIGLGIMLMVMTAGIVVNSDPSFSGLILLSVLSSLGFIYTEMITIHYH